MKNSESGLNFDNSYFKLHNLMYSKIVPSNKYKSSIAVLNTKLAEELGISVEFLESEKGKLLLSGSTGSGYNDSFAQAYSGHQFGYLSSLGDGRALVLGEHVTKEGIRYDLQLKGSGVTPYSRRGDGKATLYSMLREHIISEAMFALNIPTTRSLAVLKTNELIMREKLSQGSVLARVARSHIRVGTFTHARANGLDVVSELADYTINRHYSHLNNKPDKYVEFLIEVIKNQASLIAKWQSVGFIHGVMNTDNMLISGETIDYGPCAFMDVYDPNVVFSSIDVNKRYAYGNQPYIGSWNLARFTESILHLLSENQEEAIKIANDELSKYQDEYSKSWVKNMDLKIGILKPKARDKELIQELLDLMELHGEDFTNTFRKLSLSKSSKIILNNSKGFTKWIVKWQRRLIEDNVSIEDATKIMKKHNPVIIPRNSIIEEALIKASKEDDFSMFNELLNSLYEPFNYGYNHKEKYINVKNNDEKYTTHCGT